MVLCYLYLIAIFCSQAVGGGNRDCVMELQCRDTHSPLSLFFSRPHPMCQHCQHPTDYNYTALHQPELFIHSLHCHCVNFAKPSSLRISQKLNIQIEIKTAFYRMEWLTKTKPNQDRRPVSFVKNI